MRVLNVGLGIYILSFCINTPSQFYKENIISLVRKIVGKMTLLPIIEAKKQKLETYINMIWRSMTHTYKNKQIKPTSKILNGYPGMACTSTYPTLLAYLGSGNPFFTYATHAPFPAGLWLQSLTFNKLLDKICNWKDCIRNS